MAHPEAAADFIHTVTRLSRDAGLGAKGDPQYTLENQTTFRARVEVKQVTVRDADGWRRVQRTVLLTDVWLDPSDYLWLPAIGERAADDTSSVDKARSPTLSRHAADEDGLSDLYEYEL